MFDVLLFDGHLVVPTGGCSLCCWWTLGCPYWWISGLGYAMMYLPSCLLWMVTGDGMVLEVMDLPSCLLRLVTGNWTSGNFSLTIRWHLGSRVPASPGVASSLDSVFFTSGCWSRCLPSDAEVPSSDCDFFHFFTALCSVSLDDRCVLSYLILITHFIVWSCCLCCLHDCVAVCSALCFAGWLLFLILRFLLSFLYMLLQSLDFSTALPVTVFRLLCQCFVAVFDCCIFIVWVREFGSLCLFVFSSVLTIGILWTFSERVVVFACCHTSIFDGHSFRVIVFAFYHLSDIFLNELSF